jgi:hypothetical protein
MESYQQFKKNGENLPTKKGFDIFDEQNNPRNVYF